MVLWTRFWLLLACTAAWGTNYYVNNNHPQADDANAGTAGLPWKTIGKAASVAAAGDTVIVDSGVYNERISLPRSGSQGNKIVFKARPRRTVRMQGFYTGGANFIRMEGFDITYDQGGWNGGGIWLSSSNLDIVDNYFHDIPGPGIQSSWSGGIWDSIYISGNHIYRCQYGMTVSGTNFLVEDNEVERLYQFGGGDCDYARFFGDNITFRNNYFHGTIFSEIGSAHLDCWQTFDDNGEHAANITWDGNWCSECHEGLMAEGIYHHNSHHFTFINNVFAHSGAWGLCVSDGISYINVFNNTFYDIKYYGVGFGGSYTTNVTVKNNIFSRSGQAILVNNGAPPITEDYNLLYQSGTGPGGAHDLVNIDPQFVDAVNNDLHLQPTSPAINAGTDVGVNTDYDGNLRPYNGGYDLGAFEYGAPPAAIREWVGSNRLPVRNGSVINPWPGITFRSNPGLPEHCQVYDLGGRPLAVQSLRRTGIYAVKARGDRTWQKIIIIK